MSVQVVVDKDTGGVQAIYVWSDDSPYQGGFTYQGLDGWYVDVEHKEADSLDVPMNEAHLEVGWFPTLHTAVQAYLACGRAVRTVTTTPYGEVVLG